jgi:hypothetical protein
VQSIPLLCFNRAEHILRSAEKMSSNIQDATRDFFVAVTDRSFFPPDDDASLTKLRSARQAAAIARRQAIRPAVLLNVNAYIA